MCFCSGGRKLTRICKPLIQHNGANKAYLQETNGTYVFLCVLLFVIETCCFLVSLCFLLLFLIVAVYFSLACHKGRICKHTLQVSLDAPPQMLPLLIFLFPPLEHICMILRVLVSDRVRPSRAQTGKVVFLQVLGKLEGLTNWGGGYTNFGIL